MITSHVVTLRLAKDGSEIRIWDEVRLTIDLFSAGSAWTLSIWRSSVDGSTWEMIRTKVLLGTRVQILIDGALQVEGNVETADPECSRGGSQYVISGRDLSARAIDGHADPATQIRGRSTGDAIAEILVPFDVPFVVEAEAEASRDVAALVRPGHRGSSKRKKRRHKPVDLYRIKPGQSAWAVCEDIAHKAGCLLWTGPTDAGTGIILDTPVQSGESLFKFERIDNGNGTYRGNVFSSHHSYSVRGIPTALTYFTHGGVIADSGQNRATAYNGSVTSSPMVEGDGSCDFACQQYVSTREARNLDELRKYIESHVAKSTRNHWINRFVVQGFGQTTTKGKRLYAVNMLADRRDDNEPEQSRSGQSLITRVAFSQARGGGQGQAGGQMTEVTMLPPSFVEVFPDE